MGLKSEDLKDTVLSKVSIDEFEPKTGDSKDVLVLGFHVVEQNVGDDLYSFINSSVYEIRDVEVSPNPNKSGYYMVFIEMDRNKNVLKNIRNIISDVENVSGKLSWKGKTHLNDKYIPVFEDEIENFIITEPSEYMTKEEWEERVAQEEEQEKERKAEEERLNINNQIMEFMKPSSLLGLDINENKITLRDSKNHATLEIVNFGPAKDIMEEVGISESAIGTLDSRLRLFNHMLGEMRAIPIDDYIVIFNPVMSGQDKVLVTKQC